MTSTIHTPKQIFTCQGHMEAKLIKMFGKSKDVPEIFTTLRKVILIVLFVEFISSFCPKALLMICDHSFNSFTDVIYKTLNFIQTQ